MEIEDAGAVLEEGSVVGVAGNEGQGGLGAGNELAASHRHVGRPVHQTDLHGRQVSAQLYMETFPEGPSLENVEVLEVVSVWR